MTMAMANGLQVDMSWHDVSVECPCCGCGGCAAAAPATAGYDGMFETGW